MLTSRGDPFLNTGMTLDILSVEGKIPAVKELLINWEIGIEISCLRSLRIRTGILFGPDAFDKENELMTLVTSSGVVGDKKIDLGLEFRRDLEKLCLVGGTVDLMVSAIEVKKSLKELATISGSDETELPTVMEIGFEDFDLVEIRFLTPVQTFRMLDECWLK